MNVVIPETIRTSRVRHLLHAFHVQRIKARLAAEDDIVVTSVLQTTAGRMIFGRHAEGTSAETPSRPDNRSERADRDEPGRRPRSAAQA